MSMTTELALLVSKAKASVFTMKYISQFEASDIDSDDVDLRFEVDGVETGTNVSIVDECGQAAQMITALVEALEASQHVCDELQQGFIANQEEAREAIKYATELKEQIGELVAGRLNLLRTMGVYVHAYEEAKSHISELERFKTAFTEWLDKTEWVQTDKRFDVVKPWGKHRAEVLKLYIEHLEAKLETAEKLQDNAFRHGLQHGFSLGQTDNQAGFEQCMAAYSQKEKNNG